MRWDSAYGPCLVLPTLLMLLGSCSSSEKKPSDPISDPAPSVRTQQEDTLHTSAGPFRVLLTATDTLYIVTDVDTLYRWTETTNGFTVEDLDGDGNEDVLINHVSNVGGLNDLIIYLPKEKRFAQVKDFTDFPNAMAVPGAPYYYSYRRAGCADGDWISDLFEIRADSTLWHGHLFGHGCQDGPPPSITMLHADPSLPEEQWQRVDSLPMDSAWNGAGDKWDFIARYWADNYRRYLPRAK
jgi:hypothetical protein